MTKCINCNSNKIKVWGTIEDMTEYLCEKCLTGWVINKTGDVIEL